MALATTGHGDRRRARRTPGGQHERERGQEAQPVQAPANGLGSSPGGPSRHDVQRDLAAVLGGVILVDGVVAVHDVPAGEVAEAHERTLAQLDHVLRDTRFAAAGC